MRKFCSRPAVLQCCFTAAERDKIFALRRESFFVDFPPVGIFHRFPTVHKKRLSGGGKSTKTRTYRSERRDDFIRDRPYDG